MKKNIITAFLGALLISSCFSDKSNYDYVEINKTTIEPLDHTHTIFADIGILKMEANVNMTMANPDDERFEYLWIAVDRSNTAFRDTIAYGRAIDWQATLPNGNYNLIFRMVDKETGMVEQARPKANPSNPSQTDVQLNISVYHSRGIMLIGDNAQGYAQVQMITMLAGQEEAFYDDLLQFSELPPLTGAIDFFHTGNSSPATIRELWIVTQSGSYFLNRFSLRAQPYFNIFNDKLYFSESTPINVLEIAPKIRSNNGDAGTAGSRIYRCDNGGVYVSYTSIYGDLYDLPGNSTDGTGAFGRARGELLYSLNSYGSCCLWYDRDNECFAKQGSALITAPTKLDDNPGDIFPWKQNGRTYVYGENTFNTDGGSSNGNSFAIMQEIGGNAAENYDYCLYKLYSNGTPAKRGFYVVDKTAAPLFGSATMYAFSSKRSAVFYVAGGKLYAYDYDSAVKRNYEMVLADNNEVTMIKFDVQREPNSDFLYVATYSASTGGTLYKYAIDADLNLVKLKSTPDETWRGLMKVKNMNWRGSE